jgi:GDP/UDP-N,N'-diacetylbacillosamine 2-epimerase (hydrolysing)
MKKIAVVTATRAEYGLLSPVIRELRKSESNNLRIDLIVTGTHLSEQYGLTINEIKERIDHRITISVKSDSEDDISANQAEALVRFTELFMRERYNAVILLGDRYETLAIAIAAGNTRTPVFHLCGGDTTEGALDECIRHSISKISYLHFVTMRKAGNG